jgi:hypothetical protein
MLDFLIPAARLRMYCRGNQERLIPEQAVDCSYLCSGFAYLRGQPGSHIHMGVAPELLPDSLLKSDSFAPAPLWSKLSARDRVSLDWARVDFQI